MCEQGCASNSTAKIFHNFHTKYYPFLAFPTVCPAVRFYNCGVFLIKDVIRKQRWLCGSNILRMVERSVTPACVHCCRDSHHYYGLTSSSGPYVARGWLAASATTEDANVLHHGTHGRQQCHVDLAEGGCCNLSDTEQVVHMALGSVDIITGARPCWPFLTCIVVRRGVSPVCPPGLLPGLSKE